MEKLKLSTQNKNKITAILVITAGCVLLSWVFDLYYDMNDDVMIKDILAGIYTGTPDGHNIQMMFSLAFIISLFYKMLPAFPWFGIFLAGCLMLSFYLLLTKTLALVEKRSIKIAITGILMLLYIGLLLWEMIYVQYTVVCGVLAMTASVCLYLTPKTLPAKEFIKKNIGNIFLVVIAFNLRSEMLLLMSPFIAAAGLFKWGEEKKIFAKESFIRYGTILVTMILLMGCSAGINTWAYHTDKWQQFVSFFDARTSVYDFTWYPDYESNEEFYQNAGISKAQYELIQTYNFGIDETIDAKMLEKIASYQKTELAQNTPALERVKDTIGKYRYQLTRFYLSAEHETRVMPYSLLVVLLYGWLFLLAFFDKNFSWFAKLPILLLFRSAAWCYILYNGRVVARLTHPLYLIEIMILSACIFSRNLKWQKNNQSLKKQPIWQQKAKWAELFLLCICIGSILITIPSSLTAAKAEKARREEVNLMNEALQAYCAKHPKEYYYVDVYSTVAFSQKLFLYGNSEISNYDILGGWFSKSPLSDEKAARFGITDAETDFLEKDNLYFIAEKTADLSWITHYYSEKGKKVNLVCKDTITVKESDRKEVLPLFVYQIRKQE